MNNYQFYFRPIQHLFLLLLLVVIHGCSERKSEDRKIKLVDDLNRTVMVKENPARFMALSSSLTEMLFILCDDDQVVARTHNCDYPAAALKKEVISNYPIDYEGLLKVNPDLVFAKEGIISLEEAAKIESIGIPIYFQKYDKVDDILKGIETLGIILNKKERSLFVSDSLKKEIALLHTSVANKKTPRVLILISKEQLFAFGKQSYASDILTYAGAFNAINETFNNAYPQITSEYILKINPDILIGLKGTGMENGDFFELYPELKRLDLYKNKKYYSFPEDLLSRPGPRVGETIRQLIKIIHPDVQ